MDAIRSFYFLMGEAGRKIAGMEHDRLTGVERVIHVPLSESDWKAFIAATPQPVDWLRNRIKEAIARGENGEGGNAERVE